MSGISDSHKMVVTVLKIPFEKSKPKVVLYRYYRHFENQKHNVPMKKKVVVRANHKD